MNRLLGGLSGTVVGVIRIVVLVALAVGAIRWASANPGELKQLLGDAMQLAVRVVTDLLNWIAGLLPKK